MSLQMEQAANAILQAATEIDSARQSDVDPEPDTSSSLSEPESKDSHLEDEGDISDEQSNVSADENDSEAETERLEDTPHKIRPHKAVVLTSHNETQIYQRSPTSLRNQIIPNIQHNEEEEEDELLSDDDLSSNESPKSSVHDDDPKLATATTSLDNSAGESNRTLSITETDTRKRKRSIMAGSGLDDDEPLRKRTGSIMAPGDDFAIDDEELVEEDEVDQSNPISGTISGDEGGEEQDGVTAEDLEEPTVPEEEEISETAERPTSPKRRGRKKKKAVENGVSNHEDDPEVLPEADPINGVEGAGNGEEEIAEAEAVDEAEVAARNEEELEKKRIAADQLSALEKQFTTFRDRLYDERLEAFNREEAMLRDENSTHPTYLAMMKAVDARRDKRVRINDKLREYEEQTLRKFAVARRSQILVQYQQDVREIREQKLEQLGKSWYEIQHDRRSYAGSVPDYTLRFPIQKSQQVMNQIAYSNEVSILSGVAKYVGFPAAPTMSMATESELADDFAKMGRSRHPMPVQHAPGSALHELAAMRSAVSRFKPAEEQFIEQTPWANPHHPSHALQRQASISHAAHRRPSHQHNSAGPISGTFSAIPTIPQTNGVTMSGGRISPHNPFSSSVAAAHTITPSPLATRRSISPPPNRQPLEVSAHQHNQPEKVNGVQHSPAVVHAGPPDLPPQRRGLLMGQF